MIRAAVVRFVAVASAALVVSSCGSPTGGDPSASAPAGPVSSAPPAATAEPSAPAPKAQTIRDYITANGLQETVIHRGDAGAPTVDLPWMDGWEDAGSLTPEWAYSAVVYRGPRPEDYTPNIVVLMSKLTDAAPGELAALTGWAPIGDQGPGGRDDYPSYRLDGTWVRDGVTKVVAQTTVVIPADDRVYVVQFNADAAQSEFDIAAAGLTTITQQAIILP
ncbi:putative lipoprotein LpqN [Mycobacterium sp. BK558]|nr:LpqN/LpqT family lipoprotein [Mycolicibacterium rufum]RZT25395.1 putative lipoprotein LpqN [Mycobacterium sp. BK558]